MQLYNSIGPNPKCVRMFMAEKGIELPKVEVDLMGNENRGNDYLKKNPHGQTPALELDNGKYLSEITVICEYLDEKFPGGDLIGKDAEQRGETRMWTRRVDLNICEPMANGFRYGEGRKLFEKRIKVIPEASDGLKAVAADRLAWLDKQLDGKQFICGDRFSLADVLLFSMLEFFSGAGQPLNPELKNINAWFERVKARPSASA